MAEITYDSILSSKPYCFLVGPQEREFFIHASLAAKKSSVLDSIVSNGLTKQEANGTAVWRHVDEDTFVRFGQYVYTGDYEGSAPSQPTTAEAPPPPVAEEKEEPEPQPLPDKVAEEKPVDSPVREPATHVELEAVVEPVPDEAVVPEKDVWGFFTSRGKVGGDYDWGFSTIRASKPADDEPAGPEAEAKPAPWPEEAADTSLPRTSKKSKKGKKSKRVLIAPEPWPPVTVVECVIEEEPAATQPACEDFWNLRNTEPESELEPASEPAPAEEELSDAPVSRKKKNKRRVLIESEPEPAEAVIESVVEKEPKANEPPLPMLKDVWHSFTKELRYDTGTGAGHFEAPGNAADSALEYAGVFLSHARVHALADEFRVEPLAQLALHKLHRTLCAFTLHEARIGDVVALLRYSYEERQRLGEQLRALVSKFAACHLKTLWTSEAFRALFAACGELAVAIVGHVIDKLN